MDVTAGETAPVSFPGVESKTADRDSGRDAQAAEVSSGAAPVGEVQDPANACECPPVSRRVTARRGAKPVRGPVTAPREAPAPVRTEAQWIEPGARIALPASSAMDDRAAQVALAQASAAVVQSQPKPGTMWCALCAWHKPVWMGRDCIEGGCPVKRLHFAEAVA